MIVYVYTYISRETERDIHPISLIHNNNIYIYIYIYIYGQVCSHSLTHSLTHSHIYIYICIYIYIYIYIKREREMCIHILYEHMYICLFTGGAPELVDLVDQHHGVGALRDLHTLDQLPAGNQAIVCIPS